MTTILGAPSGAQLLATAIEHQEASSLVLARVRMAIDADFATIQRSLTTIAQSLSVLDRHEAARWPAARVPNPLALIDERVHRWRKR